MVQASCLLPLPLQKTQIDTITAETNCIDRFAIAPLWIAQCNSIKNDRIRVRNKEDKEKNEKTLKESSDRQLARAHANEWDTYKDVADYPNVGTYPCKLDTMKAMGGGNIVFGTSSAKECDSWVSNSHDLGLNKPAFLNSHPDLVSLFLDGDRAKASSICSSEGGKLGYSASDVTLSSESYYDNAMIPGDGRYHCNVSTPAGSRTFYSFTHVDGSMSKNEMAANRYHNYLEFKNSVEHSNELPFVAEIDCGGYPLSLCFGVGGQTIYGEIEIRDGDSYKMYSGYAFLGQDFILPVHKKLLHKEFYIKIRNGSGYNQVNLKIFNSLTGDMIFEKSAGPYETISVKN